MSIDHLSDALNSIKVHEMVGKEQCSITATKTTKRILDILKDAGYIKDYKNTEERGTKKFLVDLDGRINNCGVIKPRLPVKKNEWAKVEHKYIPAIGIGVLIVSTPKGITTNSVAQQMKMGGRLIAYVY